LVGDAFSEDWSKCRGRVFALLEAETGVLCRRLDAVGVRVADVDKGAREVLRLGVDGAAPVDALELAPLSGVAMPPPTFLVPTFRSWINSSKIAK